MEILAGESPVADDADISETIADFPGLADGNSRRELLSDTARANVVRPTPGL